MNTNIAKSATGNITQSVVAYNQLDGDREVSLTFTEGNTADVTDVVLLPSLLTAILKTFSATANTNITASSPDNFSSNFYGAWYANFAMSKYSIKNIRLSTTDTDNLKGTLKYKKVQLDGQSEEVKKPLIGLRVNVGNGYSDTVEIPNWLIMKDPKSELTLSKVKRNTAVTLTFTIDSVDDAANMILLNSQSIR